MNDIRVLVESTTHDPFEKNTNEYRSMLIYGVIAFSLAVFIRFFVAAPYLVQGASMDPTFHSADYLIVDRLSYQFEKPGRGDVIVFHFPQDPSRSFIKRIIGLPGETIEMQDNIVRIINDSNPEGFTIAEPYVDPSNERSGNIRVLLDESEYFVLGDNRKASADSRVWGALPEGHIVGRALIRLYPFTNIDINPGSATYSP